MPTVGLSLLALLPDELVQVRGGPDSLSSSALHLAGEELLHDAPPGRRDASVKVLGKKLSSLVTRVTSGNSHKSSCFNQEIIIIRGVTSVTP